MKIGQERVIAESDDDKLTDDVIHIVLRHVLRGGSVDKGFERAGVDPALGDKWLREGARYDHYTNCYKLRIVIEKCMYDDMHKRVQREMSAILFPPDALWVRALDTIIDKIMDARDKRRKRFGRGEG